MATNAEQLPTDHRQPAPGEARRLLDVPSLAQQLAVTPRFVRRLVAEHRVPFLKLGKFIRFDPAEIEQWVDGTRRPVSGPPGRG